MSTIPRWKLLTLSLAAALALVTLPDPRRFAARAQDAGLPDLVVDQKALQNHWLVRDETFTADECAAIEGGIAAGDHRVLRFTVNTPNIGTADLFLGDPNVHVAAGDGLYEFAQCHQHFHFRHYATYELVDPVTQKTWRAAKRGFCMIDVVPAPQLSAGPPKHRQYGTCGRAGVPGNQGISTGWGDQYGLFLQGQLFVLDGGDGQDPVPPGRYLIRITVNPPFSKGADDKRCFLDANGLCHQLPELDYTDNVAEAVVDVADHPGRSGKGPGAKDDAPGKEALDDNGDRID
jgi:hypothetical protein